MSTSVVKTVLDAATAEKEASKGSEKVEPKDFFWDQFVKYLSSAILALTIINITVEFFRGGDVSCFHPPDTSSLLPSHPGVISLAIYGFARDQASFLNSYCIASIPLTEYFPVYILVHGLLLATPHYIWSTIFKGDFDSFFSIAGKIDRLHSSETGEYSEENFDRVKKLEVEYGGSNRRIFASYILKLFLQLLVCVGSIGLSLGWLRDFSFSFQCPRQLEEDGVIPDEWPLNTTVPCVYTSLRILSIVRIADFILTGLAMAMIMYGLAWCVVRHTEQLGYKRVAKFTFQSGLKPDLFVFPPIFQLKSRKHYGLIMSDFKTNSCLWCLMWLCCRRRLKVRLGNSVSPAISNDLDFLLLQLFRADTSHGRVFRKIQIDKELKRLQGRDHQLLHLYINLQQDMQYDDYKPNVQKLSQIAREEESGRGGQQGLADEMIQRMKDVEDNGLSCCLWCLVKCFGRCFSRREDKKQKSKPNVSNGYAQEKEVGIFRDLFCEAGSTITNPEEFAYFFFKPYLGNIAFNEDYIHGVRDIIYLYISQYGKREPKKPELPSNHIAMDISFGSIGYGLVVARAFRKAYALSFHPFYRSSKVVALVNDYYTNLTSVQYPDDVYTYNNERLRDALSSVLEPLNIDRASREQTIDMLVIGPVSEEPHLISINLLLNAMYSVGYIGQGSLLLAIRPLRVGSRKIACHKFEPSKKLFIEIPEQDHKEIQYRYVDGIKSIKIKCADVSCRFEFVAYRFIGKDRYVPKAAIEEGSPQSVRLVLKPPGDSSQSSESSPRRNGHVGNGHVRNGHMRSAASEERRSLEPIVVSVANGVGKQKSARDTYSTTVYMDTASVV